MQPEKQQAQIKDTVAAKDMAAVGVEKPIVADTSDRIVITDVIDYGDNAIGVVFTVYAAGLESTHQLYVENDKDKALQQITEFASAKRDELLANRTPEEVAKDPSATIADIEAASKPDTETVFSLEGQEINL